MCKGHDNVLKKFRNIYDEKNGIFSKLKKQHEMKKYMIDDCYPGHLNYVDKQTSTATEICFVFSCPGQEELISGKVCYGQTGDNLSKLLVILNEMNGAFFPSKEKYDYCILNASNIVHFYALDEKTEADDDELASKDNYKRIHDYISKPANKVTRFILFGERANQMQDTINKICESLKRKVCIIKNIRHLGFQSVNQISLDINGEKISDKTLYKDSEQRTIARLKVVAKDIMNQIQ